MAIIDMRDEANLGVNINNLELTDEHGNEWILVEYEYQCSTSNYLEGEEFDTVEMYYCGPAKLYFWADNETGKFETVLREHEIALLNDVPVIEGFDPPPPPADKTLIELDPREFPLEAEVLSDYHNNYANPDDFLHSPGIKTIPEVPIEGYGCFQYEYPIHPDHMYDDKRTYWDWETKRVVLVKFNNQDIIGEANSWDVLRAHRKEMLINTDAQIAALEQYDPPAAAELKTYRQLLRDFPQHFEGVIDPIFVDSCLPYTDVIDLKK
tara:strand:+ start:1877 stop:2674 length:798 start_codon:yes stop_codon:yes gene_type:complete